MFPSTPEPRPSMTTLVVEDDADVAEFVKMALERAPCFDFRVVILKKLADVRRVFRQTDNRPSLIILDLSLPDGGEPMDVVKLVHSLSGDTPIVILTGHDNRILATEIIESGYADDYMVKGNVRANDIVERARNAIARARGRDSIKRLSEKLDKMGDVIERAEADPNCPPYDSIPTASDQTITTGE